MSCCFSCCSDQESTALLGDQAWKAGSEAISLYQQGVKYQEKNATQKAHECFQKAAALGLADAQIEVGLYYLTQCHDMPGNITEGSKWIQMAANQQSALAQNILNSVDNLSPGDQLSASIRSGDIIIFSTVSPNGDMRMLS